MELAWIAKELRFPTLRGRGGGGTTSPRLLSAPRPCGGRGAGRWALRRRRPRGAGRGRGRRRRAMPGDRNGAEESCSGAEGAVPGTGSEAGAVAGREPSRLCGYLQKLSGKGPLRGYRSRWFVFDSRRCYLYYFKSPQDALPLGHLDIADACFSYQGRDEAAEPGADPPTHFQVHSAGAVTVLKVGRSIAPRCPLVSHLQMSPSSFLPCPKGLLLSCPSLSSPLPTLIPSSFLSFTLYLCLDCEGEAVLRGGGGGVTRLIF